MKLELSEKMLIEELFQKSLKTLDFNGSRKEHKSFESLNSIERLTGDASTRRYYRIKHNGDSFVACLDNTSTTNKNSFVELQDFLSNAGIRVPKIYDLDLEKGYILEEDLGNKTLLTKLASIKNFDEEKKIYEDVLNELIQIHKIDKAKIEQTSVIDLHFNKEKLMSEIDFTLNYFLEKFLKCSDRKLMTSIREEFENVCVILEKQNRVFTHRDFHSRNIMVKKQENIIIDFQDARMGLPQYDLVSILEDCYYDIETSNKEKLKKYYFNQMKSSFFPTESFTTFSKIYDLTLAQRVFKAVGSFAYIFEYRKDYRYLKYIGHAMEKIRRTLLRLDETKKLCHNLFEVYYAS